MTLKKEGDGGIGGEKMYYIEYKIWGYGGHTPHHNPTWEDKIGFLPKRATNGYPSLRPFQIIFKKRNELIERTQSSSLNVEINSVLYGEWNDVNIVVLNVF